MKRIYYVEIPEDHVPSAVVKAADRMLTLVVDDLRLGRVQIRWFTARPVEERPAEWMELDTALVNNQAWAQLDGIDDRLGGTIWIPQNLSPLDAAAIVAREARHIWQDATMGSLDASDAETYQNQPELLKRWRDLNQEDDDSV